MNGMGGWGTGNDGAYQPLSRSDTISVASPLDATVDIGTKAYLWPNIKRTFEYLYKGIHHNMLHGVAGMGFQSMGGSFLYPTLIHDPEQRVLNSLRVRQASKRLV